MTKCPSHKNVHNVPNRSHLYSYTLLGKNIIIKITAKVLEIYITHYYTYF